MLTRTKTGSRRGIMCVLVAALLVILVGITAIAIDGGMLQDSKRRLQATSDAAALAAATKLFQNYPRITESTADPSGQAVAAALAVSANNGFPHDGNKVVVSVSIPPATGPFTGKLGYAEVTVTYLQPRYFGTIFGSNSIPVKSRSVALGRWGGSGKGVIVLDPLKSNALDSNGNGALTLTGGAAMIVNSSDAASAARTSGGGRLTAREFDITGGANGTFDGLVYTGVLPTPDPLAYLPEPDRPSDGTMNKTALGNGNHRYVRSPGRHSNIPSFQTGDQVIFQQASSNSNGDIFYIDGGGFSSQGASISMDPDTSGGVMLYNNPASSANNQRLSITGNSAGNVNLSALTSGPYAGILLFQNRTATANLSVSGNGSFKLTGTFYAANALLSVSGNGTATIGSQYISRTLNITGGGNIIIDYTDEGTARQRDVFLVE